MIDSHIHLWDLSLNKNPWLFESAKESFLGNISPLRKNYLINDYIKDSQNFNIEKVVHIQAGWDQIDLLGEAIWLNQFHTELLGGIVSYANLTSSTFNDELAQLAEIPLIKGIRQIIGWHTNPYFRTCEKNYLEDKTWLENFKLLHKYSLTFDLQIYPEQTDQAYELIKTNPNVGVVIEHILQLNSHDPISIKHWEEKLAKLATLPNIFMKLSGMNLFVHTFHFETLKTLFETVVHYFSPYRCMIGSNFPVEKLYISFDELFESFLKITQQYSQAEQKALFYETAKKFYRV